jgi:hypothetical protein
MMSTRGSITTSSTTHIIISYWQYILGGKWSRSVLGGSFLCATPLDETLCPLALQHTTWSSIACQAASLCCLSPAGPVDHCPSSWVPKTCTHFKPIAEMVSPVAIKTKHNYHVTVTFLRQYFFFSHMHSSLEGYL